MCRKLGVASGVMLLLASRLVAQWSTISVDTRYDQWIQSGNPTPQPSPINLFPGNFASQNISDPHIQVADSLNWLITGFGNKNFGEPGVCGDRNWVVSRIGTGSQTGQYIIPTVPMLAYPPCPTVGNLGVGPGFARTPISTVGGYKYFAVVPASYNPNPSTSQLWLSWAVSSDGLNWAFPKDPVGTPQTTSDPQQSLHLIRRTDLQAVTPSGVFRINHVALLYNKYDGFFYIVLGWAADGYGINAVWFRVQFDTADTFGLHKDAQGRYDVQMRAGSVYTTTGGGIIPASDTWVPGASDPAPADGAMKPVDPMDLVQLTNQQGGFDSTVFIYQPVRGFQDTPAPIAYVKGSLNGASNGNFGWQTPQTLDLTPMYGDGVYASSCKRESPNSIGIVQNPGEFQTDGAPQLYAYVSASLPSKYGAIIEEGLLPLKLKLSADPRVSWVTATASGADSGPNGTATATTITGTAFVAGATTVKFRGIAATNVSVTSPSTLTATTPLLGVGGADVSVTVTGKPTSTLPHGYFYDFTDVAPDIPGGNHNHDYIERLVRNGVTAGCSPSTFCPSNNIARQQMAVFLLKGAFGSAFVPPACTHLFSDVLCPSTFADWVEEAFRRGIMPACSPGQFCPGASVSRGDMAVFLLNAEHYVPGTPYTPPPCTPPPNQVFADVPCPGPQADWIQQLFVERITAGCGSNTYCPGNPNTREQMAVFITHIFCLN